MSKICGCQVVWATNGQLVPEWQARRDWRRLLGKGVAREKERQTQSQFHTCVRWVRLQIFPKKLRTFFGWQMGWGGSMWAQARAWYSNSWPARVGSKQQEAGGGAEGRGGWGSGGQNWSNYDYVICERSLARNEFDYLYTNSHLKCDKTSTNIILRERSNIISLYFGPSRTPPLSDTILTFWFNPPPYLARENLRRDRICITF